MTKRSNFDTKWLLETIKKRLSGVYNNQNPYVAIRDSLLSLLAIKQYDTESESSVLDRFESRKEAFMLISGNTILCSEKTSNKKVSAATDEEIETDIEKILAISLLCSSNNKKFGDMKICLRDREHDDYDDCPTTMQDAYERLVKSSGDVNFKNRVKGNLFKRKGGNVHVSFLQSKDKKVIVKGTDRKTWPETKCYKCHNWGHISTFCPPVD